MQTKSWITFSLSLMALFHITTCKAQTAAEVVFYHHRSSLNFDHHEKTFPLYPPKDEIPGLPKEISNSETDLSIIETYYNSVAKAYFAVAEELELKSNEYAEKIKTQQSHISLAAIRNAEKSPLTRDLNAAQNGLNTLDHQSERNRRNAINFYSVNYKPATEEAIVIRQKAEFYKELAETTLELREGIIK